MYEGSGNYGLLAHTVQPGYFTQYGTKNAKSSPLTLDRIMTVAELYMNYPKDLKTP